MNTYLKIEWWNDCDFGDMLWQTGRHDWVYIDSDLLAPEYVVEQEGGEDMHGVYTAEVQRWVKVIKCVFVAPEYLLDALHVMAVCDHVLLYDKMGQVYNVDAADIGVKWNDNGCLAVVTLSFEVDSVVKTTVCINMA